MIVLSDKIRLIINITDINDQNFEYASYKNGRPHKAIDFTSRWKSRRYSLTGYSGVLFF